MTHAFFEDIEETQDTNSKKKWYQKALFWFAIILSLLWVWASVDYMIGVEWWATRYRLSPAEFVGMVSSQILPIALIWFVVAWIEKRKQLEHETQTLRLYMNQLMYPTEEGAVYTKSLTNALRAQIKDFKVVFEQAAEQTRIVREEMKRWIKDLTLVIDHVDSKTIGSIKQMAGHIQELTQSTEKANLLTEDISKNFTQRSQLLDTTSQKVAETINSTALILNENVINISNMAESLTNTTTHTQDTLKQADHMATLFGQQTENLQQVLRKYETQTTDFNDKFYANAEKILSVLKTQGSILDQEVEKIIHKVSQANEKIIQETNHLTQASDEAVIHLTQTGTQLNQQAENLNHIMTQTDSRVRQLGTLGIEEQTKQLITASQKASDFVESINKKINEVSTDRFMKDARIILEQLATLSIDIVHIFTPKAEEEQWKKYYTGDNSAFMRYLMTAIPSDKAETFKKLYQNDAHLRVAITHYMDEFDLLIEQAKTAEQKDVLLPVFIGSDAGRLYMILKQVLGKTNKHK